MDTSCPVARFASRLRSRQVVVPLGLTLLDAHREPCGPARHARCRSQRPSEITKQPVAFDVVASEAAGDQVLPRILSAPRSRHDVVNRGGGGRAVGASIRITPQHSPSRNRNAPHIRDSYVTAQDDNTGAIERCSDRLYRMLGVYLDHRRLVVQDEHQRSSKRHNGQRLIARVEDQGLHDISLELSCMACRNNRSS